jgi:predicted amidohydrolase
MVVGDATFIKGWASPGAVRSLLAQMDARVGDKEGNLRKMEKALGTRGCDLALFGELHLSGYMARDQFYRLAEPVDGPSVRRVRRLAKRSGAQIVFGMPERAGRLLYNSSVLVTPSGEVHAYRKIHLANFGPFEEKQYFAAGREPVLVDTAVGRIGLLICYDAFFPELAKHYAMAGADILAVISASPATSTPMFDKVLPARAVENAVFVLYANLVGTELNMVFQGGTQAIGPRGEDLGRARDFREETVLVEVDTAVLPAARRARPTARDSRPELWATRKGSRETRRVSLKRSRSASKE